MAKRKNSLPSGNFRVLALDYTDPDGKRHYKSFTAPKIYPFVSLSSDTRT